MYAQYKGTTYEHTLANLVYTGTDQSLIPLATGHNQQESMPVDMVIDDGEAVHVFETKRTSQDAYTFHYEEDDYQKDDLYNLCKFCIEYPRPAYPYYAVRFNRRAIVIGRIYLDDWPNQELLLDHAVRLCPVSAKVTRADNLRVYKPDLDEYDWPSTDLDMHDTQNVLDAIGWQL